MKFRGGDNRRWNFDEKRKVSGSKKIRAPAKFFDLMHDQGDGRSSDGPES